MRSHLVLTPREYEASRAGHFHARRLAFLLDAAATVPAGGTAVELGCGPGSVLADVSRARPDLRCLGLDVDDAMVAYANDAHGHEGLSFAVAQVGRDPIPAEADFVFAIDVLHHVDDPAGFLRAVSAALAPGGVVAAIEPNSLHPYVAFSQERMRRQGLDEDHFRRQRWEAAFAAAGLRVESRLWLHAFPAVVRSVPPSIARVERLVERVPPLAGSVAYVLRRTGA
jgi:trans-aconitate methyltransferase